ncbi:hypothetical protein C1H46_015687 [Malus baccata]|uniref:Uncharacterized protein n=1 Tax=Malus baccata TaxID=106549 RepID=A0A540MIW4_MALBA|nr:hypothetical protein C1H46_015687 [Malus baccata]
MRITVPKHKLQAAVKRGNMKQPHNSKDVKRSAGRRRWLLKSRRRSDLAGNNHLWFNLDDGMLGDNFFDELPGDNFSDGLPEQ